MPNSVLPGRGQKTPSLLLTYPAPPPPTPVTLPSLPPPLSLPSIILATFSIVQWALTKKLSALSEASQRQWLRALTHPQCQMKAARCVDRVPRLREVVPLSHTELLWVFFLFFYFTPQSLLSSKVLNEIIYSVPFALSSSTRFLTHHTDPSHPPPPPSPSWGRPLVSERGPRGP